jgi:hypothetical protein
MRTENKILVESIEEKRLLGRPRHTWVNNTKTDLHEIWCGLDSCRSDRDNKWVLVNNKVTNLHVT